MDTVRNESDRVDPGGLASLNESMRRGDISAWAGWRPEFIGFDEVLSMWREVSSRLGSPGYPDHINVYVNVPVCASLCRYCMYWKTRSDQVSLVDYVDYLVSAIDMWGSAGGRRKAFNCYVGGGTASILPAKSLQRVVDSLAGAFDFRNERTIEVNPDSFNRTKLKIVGDGGFNRISMGIQSLDRGVLAAVGRKNPGMAKLKDLVNGAGDFGILTNMDLICGLPGQTPESLQHDLLTLAAMRPDTITVYRFQATIGLDISPERRMQESRFAWHLGDVLNLAGQDRWSLDIRKDGDPVFMFATRVGSVLPYDTTRDYTFMDEQDRQLIGIGPGARSHIVGRMWATEVTPMDSVRAGCKPLFWGTRISPEEEALTAIRAALSSSGRADPRVAAEMAGIDSESLTAELLARVNSNGLLKVGQDSIEFCAEADESSRRTILDRLMPHEPCDEETSIRDSISRARSLGPLVPPVVREGIYRRRDCFLAARYDARSTVSPRVRAWFLVTGLDADNLTVAGARLMEVARDTLVFRSPDAGAALRVQISSPVNRECCFRSRHFMFSWAKDGAPLTAGETNVLEELKRITQACDP